MLSNSKSEENKKYGLISSMEVRNGKFYAQEKTKKWISADLNLEKKLKRCEVNLWFIQGKLYVLIRGF